jgi:hypothetical protein
MIYIILAAILLAFGAGMLVGYKIPKNETEKLKKIAFEIENIEKSAEARLRIQIHQVTARIKSIL